MTTAFQDVVSYSIPGTVADTCTCWSLYSRQGPLLVFMLPVYACLFCRHSSGLLHGNFVNPVEERWPDSLMAVKHQLRFLGYLPHPHRAVPSSCGHAALAAQAVQSCNGILMTKPAATINGTRPQFKDNRPFKAGRNHKVIRCSQSFHVCVLVYVPHFNRTVMRGAVKVVSSSPE